jgi:hypothetical protein
MLRINLGGNMIFKNVLTADFSPHGQRSHNHDFFMTGRIPQSGARLPR